MWLGWGESRVPDHPARSLARHLPLALRGFRQTLQALFKRKPAPPRGRLATSIAPVLLLAVFFAAGTLRAQDAPKPDAPQEKPPATQPSQNSTPPPPATPASQAPAATPPATGQAPAQKTPAAGQAPSPTPPASGQLPVP